MYLQLIADLLVLALLFRIFLGILVMPVSVLQAAVTPRDREFLSSAVVQVLVNAVFAGLVGTSVSLMAGLSEGNNPWLFGLVGFLVTSGVLVNNLRSKMENEKVPFSSIAAGAFAGANIGVMLGLVVYFLAVLLPSIFLAVPGMAFILDSAYGVASWLTGFGLVQFLIYAAAVVWLIKTGLKTIFMFFVLGGVATHGVLSFLQRRGGEAGKESAEPAASFERPT